MRNPITKIVLTVFIILVIVVCFSFLIVSQLYKPKTNKILPLGDSFAVEKCIAYHGEWVSDSKECENISSEDCLSNGGYFNECASACRNNPEATVCTMQCVPVCEYSVLNPRADLIRVHRPLANQIIEGSNLEISGTARGTWYFEASFPVQIQSLDGTILKEGFAQAVGGWMTEDFVLFMAELKLNPDIKGKVNLVLIKDNPSGLSENDDKLIVPIEIK